jgi:hypothetical protein
MGMKNDQVLAARRALNPHRASIKLDATTNEDGSETFTPYRVTSPNLRGDPVTITRETAVADVQRLFAASIRSIPQES